MTAPELFAALVDDAGLFPPERLPMAAAVARHRADAARGHPVLTHRLLCPASQITALLAQLGDAETLRVGLIADTGPAGLRAAVSTITRDDRLELETVEVVLSGADVDPAVVDLLPALRGGGSWVFAEAPRTAGRDQTVAALDALAALGMGAKVRCGGVRAELFPTTVELAWFVHACVELHLPFKATAGLHHAVRHRDPRTGFEHHGFVNLLLAVCRSVEGHDQVAVERALALDDPAAVAAEAARVDPSLATRARRLFVAYGSCSTSEPLDDLDALGLVEKELT